MIRNIVIKNREDIPILQHIPYVIVDKYWFEVNEEFKPIICDGYEVADENGFIVSTVLEYRKDDNIALMQLLNPVNYFDLIQYGIHMDKIVFDLPQNWLCVPEVDLGYQSIIK